MDEFNPYKPGTGLKSDFPAPILNGVFSDGQIILMLNADGEEYPVKYGIGSGWESYDGGDSVKHPNGPKTLFNSNTGYSDFMSSAWDAGAKDIMMERVTTHGGPTHANNWNLLIFHWEVIQRPGRGVKKDENGQDMTDEQGKKIWEDRSFSRLLPVKYLGVIDTGDVPSAVNVSSAPTLDPLTVLDAATAGKVRNAGKDSPTYESFIDTMLKLTTPAGTPIMDFTEIGAAVASMDWYLRLHNG